MGAFTSFTGAAAASPACATIVGCAPTVGLSVLGVIELDQMQAGARMFVNGQPVNSFAVQGLSAGANAAGVPLTADQAEIVVGGVTFVGAVAGGKFVINQAATARRATRDALGLGDDATEFARLNKVDKDIGQLRAGEANTAVEAQQTMGVRLERNTASSGKPGDFLITSGPKAGQSLDMLYAIRGGNIDAANANFAKEFSRQWGGYTKVTEHLNKYDNVVMDFRNLTPANQKIVTDFLKTVPAELTKKITFIR